MENRPITTHDARRIVIIEAIVLVGGLAFGSVWSWTVPHEIVGPIGLLLIIMGCLVAGTLMGLKSLDVAGRERQATPPQGAQSQVASPDTAQRPIPAIRPADDGSLTFATLEEATKVANQMRGAAYLWEYHYLTIYLVDGTQRVLDWIATEEIVAFSLWHATVSTGVVSKQEMDARLRALLNHHLVVVEGQNIKITPKGKEYVGWRGPMPEIKPPAPNKPDAPPSE